MKNKPVAWTARSPNLNPSDFFLWGCMKLRVYRGGKTEEGRQLAEVINEVTIATRNELGMYSVSKCNGTTCGSMHMVCWWAFKACVVMTLKTGQGIFVTLRCPCPTDVRSPPTCHAAHVRVQLVPIHLYMLTFNVHDLNSSLRRMEALTEQPAIWCCHLRTCLHYFERERERQRKKKPATISCLQSRCDLQFVL